MYVARNRGAAAFVTDGLVRDLDDLESVGLPTFAMGVTPNSPQRRGPGSVGLPIVCGGVAVASGDIVVGDRDGVVVVPRARIDETLKNLERVKAMEAATLERRFVISSARVNGLARNGTFKSLSPCRARISAGWADM